MWLFQSTAASFNMLSTARFKFGLSAAEIYGLPDSGPELQPHSPFPGMSSESTPRICKLASKSNPV